MRALSTLLLGAALSIVIQACVVVAQSTIPSFPPAPLPSGEPTQPANPAANGFYQPSPAAVSKLGKYTTFIELWFAGNSFDYLFGAFPGARGINEYNAGVASGQYTQQRYPSNAPASFQVNTVYPQLPYDFQGCTNPSLDWPCASNYSYLALWQQSQNLTSLPLAPIEMSAILSLQNAIWSFGDPSEYVDGEYYEGADSGHWATDPEHHFWNELYGLDGGLNDGFIFWGSNGRDYQVPGFPVYSERTGGTGFSYYNLSLPLNAGIDGGTIPYIWQLAANYTLYDNFFKSVMGASDITFLAQAAGGLPQWGNSATACNDASNTLYGPQGAYQAVPCTYSNGFATLSSVDNCVTLSDCTIVGEVDGFLPSTFPQPLGNLNEFNLSGCANLGFAPGVFNTTANPIAPGVYGFAPPLTSRSMFDELDGANVNWAFYGKGLNSQINGNFCDPEWPNYSSHNNPLHYYANFSDPSSPYFQQHLRDDNQFFSDLSSGSLPAFSMVTMNEVYDGAVSDSDIGMMDSALIAHMNAIFASPGWKAGTTMVLIPFIDHGALWDHAAPYAGDKTGPGARVPLIAISPDHAGGGVNHYPYEHFSLRKMTQRRFGISNSIMSQTRLYAARDFTNSFDEANACFSNPCSTGAAAGAAQCSSTYTPVTGAALCSATLGSSSTGSAAGSSAAPVAPAATSSSFSAAAAAAVSSSSSGGLPKVSGAAGAFQAAKLSLGVAACLLSVVLILLL